MAEQISGRAAGRKLVETIRIFVGRATSGLTSRIHDVEAALKTVPSIEMVRNEVARTVAAIPPSSAKLDMEEVRLILDAAIARYELDVERRVSARVESVLASHTARIPVDGKQGPPGAPGKDGKDGVDGINGKDGAGIEAFDVETEDSGRFLVVRITFGGQTYEKRLQLGTVIYRGVYSNGMKAMMGDSVTFGGNYWTAMEDTEDKPGDSPAWKLVVRRGRDGKDGKDGKSYVDNSPS